MKIAINGFLDDVYMSFLRSPVACCTPGVDDSSKNDGLRPMLLERQQPQLISDPVAEPRGREWLTTSKEYTKRASSRSNYTIKRRLNAYNGFQSSSKTQRRPQISHPMDFRHVDHAVPRAKKSFRPLELSIFAAENQLSPILPHFGGGREKELPAVPPSVMCHSRSESALSQHRIPRKPVRSVSRTSMDWIGGNQRCESPETKQLLVDLECELPQAPQPARLRSMTAPANYERVKTALMEKRELEQKLRDIEEVIEERRSIYMSSRPASRSTSCVRSVRDDVPDLPETLPTPPTSFASRVASSPSSSDARPKMTPTKSFHIPSRAESFSEASAAFTTQPIPAQDHPLPSPPLPLILRAGVRPPLRKKKSFSRVSNWLFPTDKDHSRNTSLESITNAPQPTTAKDGFYQCMTVAHAERVSFDSDLDLEDGTLSTLPTPYEEETSGSEQPSPPTTWSPQSTPGRGSVRQITLEPKIRNLSVDEDGDAMEGNRRTFGDIAKGENWGVLVEERKVMAPPYIPTGVGVGVAF